MNIVRLKRMRERRPKDSDLNRCKALFDRIRAGIGMARAHWNKGKVRWSVLEDSARFEKKVTTELQIARAAVWRERDERNEFSKHAAEIAPAKDSHEMTKWRHQVDPMYDERVFLMEDSAHSVDVNDELPQPGDLAGQLPDAKDEKSYVVMPGYDSDQLADEAYSIIGDISKIVDASFASEKMVQDEASVEDCSPMSETTEPVAQKKKKNKNKTAAVKLDGLVVSELAESGHSS